MLTNKETITTDGAQSGILVSKDLAGSWIHAPKRPRKPKTAPTIGPCDARGLVSGIVTPDRYGALVNTMDYFLTYPIGNNGAQTRRLPASFEKREKNKANPSGAHSSQGPKGKKNGPNDLNSKSGLATNHNKPKTQPIPPMEPKMSTSPKSDDTHMMNEDGISESSNIENKSTM
ncbi:hypothetical protein Sjap_026286 [Stephania japonica]|uniref:Uncharacterized protein n=1 Tax=Stephania japonica TaxID=461633 RepID=A0AAP0HKB1_9MAGN